MGSGASQPLLKAKGGGGGKGVLKGGELSIAWFGMKTGAVAAWMLLWITTKTTAKRENMVSGRNPVVSTAARESLNASAVHLHKEPLEGSWRILVLFVCRLYPNSFYHTKPA